MKQQQPRPTMTTKQFEDWQDANPTPTPDLPMLRKTLAAIDADPAQWDQASWGDFNQDQDNGDWSCGTARCVAGWAATFASTVVTEGGYLSVPDTATYALGLTSYEGFELFEATLSRGLKSGRPAADREEQRANIQIVAEKIAARAGEVL